MPLVSIITPMFNGEKYINDCILSVQRQSFQDYEHIIIDNGSTDDGLMIAQAQALGDSRIKVITHEASRGAANARNAGIAQAKGRYVAFLDCDDQWKAEKLATQLKMMEYKGAVFSWSAYDVVGADGALVRTQAAIGGGVEDHLNKRMVIGCLTAMYDRMLLGTMYFEYLDLPEDFCLWYDILTRAEKSGYPTVAIPESLAIYRVHEAGVSARKGNAALHFWRALRDHVKLSPAQAAKVFLSYALNAVRVRLFAKNKDLQNA